MATEYGPSAAHDNQQPAYLIFDTESVPDGKLLARVKYGEESLTPEEAISRAQAEAREKSYTGSDFLPVTFQYPVATCVLRVGGDYRLQQITCLDAPEFRPRKIVEEFWRRLGKSRETYGRRLRLVTFNGRGFDLPLLELAAFRYGCSGREHFADRKRFDSWHFDLMEFLTNYGAFKMVGGLNLLSKILGKPGKMAVQGHMVYDMHKAGKAQDVNDYCMFDTLDTFFVFLRTRILTGELTLEDEHIAVLKAKEWLEAKATELPALKQYLDGWGDWDPWP